MIRPPTDSDATSASLAQLVPELAVLATFDPDADVPDKTATDQLRPLCDQLVPSTGHREWMLRDKVRVTTLSRLLIAGGWTGLQGVRQQATSSLESTTLQRILDAGIAGSAWVVDDLDQDELIAAHRVAGWLTDAATLARVELGDRSEPLALEPIEAGLALMDTLAPIRALTTDGCIGREDELERLRSFVNSSVDGQSEMERLRSFVNSSADGQSEMSTMQVFGIGGVGKSTLIASFVLELAEAPAGEKALWAYLDMDRPSLSSYEPDTILREVLDQVGAQLPSARRYLDSAIRELHAFAMGGGLESAYSESWTNVVPDLTKVIRDLGHGRLVVILDTFEEVQRGDDWNELAAIRLFDMLRAIAAGLSKFRLIISGRAPAARYVTPADRSRLMRIDELDKAQAVLLLRHLHRLELKRDGKAAATQPLDDDLVDDVVDDVGGSPLTIRLAARVLADEGRAGIETAVERARTMQLVRHEFTRGFLYERILDHVGGPNREPSSPLPAVARGSLALREITPELLESVVLPTIGRTDLDALAMFQSLRMERGLAYESESGRDAIHIRDELRDPTLLALSYESDDLANRIHRAAADYYADHLDLPGATRELAYHLRAGGRIAELADPNTPVPAVTHDLSDPAGEFGNVIEQHQREREREQQANQALAENRTDAAAALLADHSWWSPDTTLFRLEAQTQERLGDVDGAIEAGARDVAAALRARSAERYAAAVIGQVLMQERHGRGQDAANVLATAVSRDLLFGRPALRLQLHLNRMALLERAGLESDRWIDDLDARALLFELGDGATSDTALIRLLASTLGRDEPGWIRSAVNTIGLGSTTNSSHLRSLADAIGDWDASQPEPGRLTSAAGVIYKSASREDLRGAWFEWMASAPTIAGTPIEQVWSLQEPPRTVVEAIRRIYLWWGVDANPRLDDSGSAPHFLDEIPLDFARKELRQLERLLIDAHGSETDIAVVAQDIGIDRRLNFNQPVQYLVRELLSTSRMADLLPQLIGATLSRQPAGSYVSRSVRELIGPEWLARNHIEQTEPTRP